MIHLSDVVSVSSKNSGNGITPWIKPPCQQLSSLWFHLNNGVNFQISHVTGVTNVTSKRGMKKIGHSFIFLMSSVSPVTGKKIQKKGDPLGIKLSCLPVDTFWFHLNICINFQIFHVTGVTSVTSKREIKKLGSLSFFWCHQCQQSYQQKIQKRGRHPWNQTVLSASQHTLVFPEKLCKFSNFS